MAGMNFESSVNNQGGVPMMFAAALANFPPAGIPFRIGIRTDSPYGVYMDIGSAFVLIAEVSSGPPGTISATSPIFYNSTTGVISSQPASEAQEGYLTIGLQNIGGQKIFSDLTTVSVNDLVGFLVANVSSSNPAAIMSNVGTGPLLRFVNNTGAISEFNNNGLLALAAGTGNGFYKDDGTVDTTTYQVQLNGNGLVSFNGNTPSYNTTSAAIRALISDAIGTGSLTFATAPTFTTSILVNAGTNNAKIMGVSNYTLITFNGSESLSAMVGLFGGALGDANTLYHQAPAGGLHDLRIGSLDALTLSDSVATFAVNSIMPAIRLTTGANNGYVLTSDAVGNGSWVSPASGMDYKGAWDASTNTPTLADGVGTNGDMYAVSTGGTQFGRTFVAGGFAIYNSSIWEPVGTSAAVTSVNSATGTVQLNLSISGNVISITGGIASADISAAPAITNKLPLTGGTLTGTLNGTIINLIAATTPLIIDCTAGNVSLIEHKYNGSTVGFTGYNGGNWFAGGEAGIGTRLQAGGSTALTINPTTLAAVFAGAISATNLSGTNTGDQTTITGNAGSATVLQTARNIQGVSFNGSANIDIINGTGFVKAAGTTLSYDNTTYAPLASPALTGTPTAPTPAADDNSTKLATTAYVDGKFTGYGGTFSYSGPTATTLTVSIGFTVSSNYAAVACPANAAAAAQPFYITNKTATTFDIVLLAANTLVVFEWIISPSSSV